MPKRLPDELLCGARAKPMRERRHLYLILDDWSSGYSIRKIDLSANFNPFRPDRPIAARCIKRLPPAIFRFKAQRKLPRRFAATSGSIMAMLPVDYGTHEALVFDVHTRSARYCPLQEPNPAYPIYIPVDVGLFALADDSFELLFKPPYGAHLDAKALFWRKLTDVRPPFVCKDVTSYAVYSDKKTIFISTDKVGTFTYNTEGPLMGADIHSPWERHSGWMLPFNGHGHFDVLLQSWVGLSRESPGHLCSCEVVPVYYKDAVECLVEEWEQSSDEEPEHSSADEWERPADEFSPSVKISKEKPSVLHPQEKLVGSTLIYCGVRSYYCLLQCISVHEKLEKQSLSADEKLEEQSKSAHEKLEEQSKSADEKLEGQSASLLRLLTFCVQFDKNGDLTFGDRHIQDYRLPESVSKQFRKNPVAFWV